MSEMPSISGSSYTTSTVPILAFANATGTVWADPIEDKEIEKFRRVMKLTEANNKTNAQQAKEVLMAARIVKVFIADPDENIALDKRVLYTGEEKLTDLNDQELFFEVPIGDLLAKHNAVRAATIDKKQSDKFGRDIKLEPARIRDLKMVVVTVAQF